MTVAALINVAAALFNLVVFAFNPNVVSAVCIAFSLTAALIFANLARP